MDALFNIMRIHVLIISALLKLLAVCCYEVRSHLLEVVCFRAIRIHGMEYVYDALEEAFYLVYAVLQVLFGRGPAEHDMGEDVSHELHVHVLVLV